VARPTAFAATLQTPAVEVVQPMPGPTRTPVPPLRAAGEWQPPVIRPKETNDPVETPKKSNVPLLVLLAIALTVALVVVAIVVNELGR
jgi:hypothetical protein